MNEMPSGQSQSASRTYCILPLNSEIFSETYTFYILHITHLGCLLGSNARVCTSEGHRAILNTITEVRSPRYVLVILDSVGSQLIIYVYIYTTGLEVIEIRIQRLNNA